MKLKFVQRDRFPKPHLAPIPAQAIANNQARNKRHELLQESQDCHYCEKKLNLENSTLDHVTAKSKGGLCVVLCCEECNHRKDNMTVDEFKSKHRKWLMERRAESRAIRRLITLVGKHKMLPSFDYKHLLSEMGKVQRGPIFSFSNYSRFPELLKCVNNDAELRRFRTDVFGYNFNLQNQRHSILGELAAFIYTRCDPSYYPEWAKSVIILHGDGSNRGQDLQSHWCALRRPIEVKTRATNDPLFYVEQSNVIGPPTLYLIVKHESGYNKDISRYRVCGFTRGMDIVSHGRAISKKYSMPRRNKLGEVVGDKSEFRLCWSYPLDKLKLPKS